MYERPLLSTLGVGVCGLILGLSFGVGQVLLAQEALISPIAVDEVPKAYSLSYKIAKEANDIIASTSLDYVSATEIALDRIASKPQNDAILEKLEQIVTLLEAILRRQ